MACAAHAQVSGELWPAVGRPGTGLCLRFLSAPSCACKACLQSLHRARCIIRNSSWELSTRRRMHAHLSRPDFYFFSDQLACWLAGGRPGSSWHRCEVLGPCTRRYPPRPKEARQRDELFCGGLGCAACQSAGGYLGGTSTPCYSSGGVVAGAGAGCVAPQVHFPPQLPLNLCLPALVAPCLHHPSAGQGRRKTRYGIKCSQTRSVGKPAAGCARWAGSISPATRVGGGLGDVKCSGTGPRKRGPRSGWYGATSSLLGLKQQVRVAPQARRQVLASTSYYWRPVAPGPRHRHRSGRAPLDVKSPGALAVAVTALGKSEREP